jgi:hypothetical protein
MAAVIGVKDEKGRFLPGHPGGPGRPKKKVEEAILTELNARFTAERVADELESALAYAHQHKSPKGVMQVMTAVLEYQLGKPRQRVELTKDDMPEWMMAVFQVEPKQVNESEQIGLLNGSYINLLPADSSGTDSDQAINVDTTIDEETDKATKTPSLGEETGINVDTTMDRGASGQRKEEERE